MLKFVGKGSAFNTQLGNNSAYIKNDNKLFLIDCGSSTFSKIMEMKLLDGVDEIFVLITHTHPDHIGSLGDLIFYSYYSMGKMGEKCITVLSPIDVAVNAVLKIMGVNSELYKSEKIKAEHVNYLNIGSTIVIQPIKVKHVPELSCYGYELYYKSESAYYSGDCYEIPKDILIKVNGEAYDYFYQDTCIADYDGNVHLSLKKLNEVIKDNMFVRNKIYCMHLDNNFDYQVAKAMGFKIVG